MKGWVTLDSPETGLFSSANCKVINNGRENTFFFLVLIVILWALTQKRKILNNRRDNTIFMLKIPFYRFLIWKISFLSFFKEFISKICSRHIVENGFPHLSLNFHPNRWNVHAFTTFMYIEIFKLFFFCVKAHRITIKTRKKLSLYCYLSLYNSRF